VSGAATEPLLALALFLGLTAASSAAGYGCLDDEGFEVPEWARETVEPYRFQGAWEFWLFDVEYMLARLPFAAVAAWCLWRRRQFRSGVPLHSWTPRFGAVAAVVVCVGALRPWVDCCVGGGVAPALVDSTQDFGTLSCMAMSFVMLVLKLRSLGRPGAARAAGAFFVASICVGLWLVFDEALRGAELFASLFLLGYGAGFWGLLASATSAARSASRARRLSAAWVTLTAVCLVADAASLFAMLWFQVRKDACGDDRACVFRKPISLFLHYLVESFSVVLLSGLVGSPEVQRIADGAFVTINEYTEEQLQRHYERFLGYLDEAQIKWVRCGFLRCLAADGRNMVRCQDVPAAETILGAEGFPRSREEAKRRYVVSHPWLSKEHPDPGGQKLHVLLQQLNALGAEDDAAVFIDYSSLPQHDCLNLDLQRLERENRWPKAGEHPAVRTEAEDELFGTALASMELLYSFGSTPVIVLPMDECTTADRRYISRGWCFLEICLALSFGNIVNVELHPPVKLLVEDAIEKEADTVDGFREAFQHTGFTYSGDADVVLGLFEHTINKRRDSVASHAE
jgi:hypothetical protein